MANLAVPVQMAEKALAGYPPELKRLAVNTLASRFSRGRIDEAIARLDESVKASGGVGVPQDWAFLAMAHQKKGNGEVARGWLVRSQTGPEGRFVDGSGGVPDLPQGSRRTIAGAAAAALSQLAGIGYSERK